MDADELPISKTAPRFPRAVRNSLGELFPGPIGDMVASATLGTSPMHVEDQQRNEVRDDAGKSRFTACVRHGPALIMSPYMPRFL